MNEIRPSTASHTLKGRFKKASAVGVATTDFPKNPTYNSGYDVCRGVSFAASVNTDHAFSIIAVGFSGANSSGGNIAMAEYLPRNRVYIFSGDGFAGAPVASAGAGGDASNSAAGDGPGAAALLLSDRQTNEDLLLSA